MSMPLVLPTFAQPLLNFFRYVQFCGSILCYGIARSPSRGRMAMSFISIMVRTINQNSLAIFVNYQCLAALGTAGTCAIGVWLRRVMSA